MNNVNLPNHADFELWAKHKIVPLSLAGSPNYRSMTTLKAWSIWQRVVEDLKKGDNLAASASPLEDFESWCQRLSFKVVGKSFQGAHCYEAWLEVRQRCRAGMAELSQPPAVPVPTSVPAASEVDPAKEKFLQWLKASTNYEGAEAVYGSAANLRKEFVHAEVRMLHAVWQGALSEEVGKLYGTHPKHKLLVDFVEKQGLNLNLNMSWGNREIAAYAAWVAASRFKTSNVEKEQQRRAKVIKHLKKLAKEFPADKTYTSCLQILGE